MSEAPPAARALASAGWLWGAAATLLLTGTLARAMAPAAGTHLHIFRELFTTQDGPFALVALGVLAAAALLAWRWNGPLPDFSVPPRRAFAVGTLGALGLLVLELNLTAYHAHPLAMDEYAPQVQAQVFASGHLGASVPAELLQRAFPFAGIFFFVSPSGTLVSTYWPVHAALLTPFVALGLPGLLNALVAVLTVVALFKLAQRLLGVEAAWWACLFLLASPVFIVNAMSLYSMPLHLLASLSFTLLLLRDTRRADLAAGFLGALALNLHSPVPHLAYALPWAAWVARQPGGTRRVATVAVGYLVLGLPLLVGWLVVRGSNGSAYASIWALPDGRRLVDEAMTWSKLVTWFVPTAALVALSDLRRRPRGPLAVMWLGLATTVAIFLAYQQNQGHGWGPRYLFPACAVLMLSAGRFVASAGPAVRRFSMVLVAMSAVLLVPLRVMQASQFVGAHLAQLDGLLPSPTPDVVFVRRGSGYYDIDLIQNDPLLKRAPLMLRSDSRADEEAFMSARGGDKARRVAQTSLGSAWVIER